MDRFKLYKHVNNTDVAICPINRPLFKDGFYIYEVAWFNIVQHRLKGKKPWLIDTETIRIKAEDIKNWILWSDMPRGMRV